MKGAKSKGSWSFGTRLRFPTIFVFCCVFFFFAGFYGSMLLSHVRSLLPTPLLLRLNLIDFGFRIGEMTGNFQDIPSDGGGMARPRLLESAEERSEELQVMASGETGDSDFTSIPFQVLGFSFRFFFFARKFKWTQQSWNKVLMMMKMNGNSLMIICFLFQLQITTAFLTGNRSYQD